MFNKMNFFFLKLELINLVNDDRFTKATLEFLLVQLNVFVEKLKGLLSKFV